MDSESLIFFGSSPAEFAYMAEAGDASAEERIKSLLGESADRGIAARRRVVRRPLGGHPADGSSPSLSAGEPLSDLLLHLAASRKGGPGGTQMLRAAGETAVSSMLSSLADLEGKRPPEACTPAQQVRGSFVKELMLSALAQPAASLDLGPLDGSGVQQQQQQLQQPPPPPPKS